MGRAALGLTVSLALHGGLGLLALRLPLLPAPMPMQALAPAEMRMGVLRVDQQAALESTPDSLRAGAAVPAAARAPGQGVPARRGRAVEAYAMRAEAMEAAGQGVRTNAVASHAGAAAVVLSPEEAARAEPAAQRARAASFDGAPLSAIAGPSTAVRDSAPEAPAIVPLGPQTAMLVPRRPRAEALAEAITDASAATALAADGALVPPAVIQPRQQNARLARVSAGRQAAIIATAALPRAPEPRSLAATRASGATLPEAAAAQAHLVHARLVPSRAAPATVAEQSDAAASMPLSISALTLALRPGATAVAETTPDAPRVEAALDWSAAGALRLDEGGLATLRAFLTPAAAAGQAVRDGMAAALKAPDCARVRTIFDPETGALELRGHVPDAADSEPLIAALRAEIGDTLPLRDNLRILPDPQCSLLDGVDRIGLPQSEEQLTNPNHVGENAFVREYEFGGGDRLIIDLMTPDYAAYLYVDYFDSAGQVLHLTPHAALPLARHAAAQAVSVGRDGAFELRIAPPFGQDIAVAFAASQPLYPGLRPAVEPARAYLEFLRDRVAALRAADAGFKGEWVYLFVATYAAEN